MTIRELYEQIDKEVSPFRWAESWDNAGLLAGDPERNVTAALVCLDITPRTIAEAAACGANVLVSHHPVIFHPLRRLTADETACRLVREDMGAICAHTNLDVAEGGVNDALARALSLTDLEGLEPAAEGQTLGRIGTLPAPLSPDAFAAYVEERLRPAGGVRYVSGREEIRRVAVCGGAGGSLASLAKERGAQALVTGEVKHDVYVDCAARGFTVLDAGHFDTECVVLEPLAGRLAALCPGTPFIVSRAGSPVKLAGRPKE